MIAPFIHQDLFFQSNMRSNIANMKKRKIVSKVIVKRKEKSPALASWGDEDISSADDASVDSDEVPDDEEEEEESAESKRHRLAKRYLQDVYDANDDDEDFTVSDKLKTERLISKGGHYSDLSKAFNSIDLTNCSNRDIKGFHSSITCLVISKDESTVFNGCKDNSVVKCDLETGAKTELKGRWAKSSQSRSNDGEVLSVAITSDGRYLASGGRDNVIRIYDQRMHYSEVNTLKGHRDAVTSLSFRNDSYALFSGSLDRCLKHWDLNEMAYIETMFGHQDAVYSVDCWTKEKPISSSSDRSVRIWKVAEETHLVFRGHKSSIDNVQWLTDSTFVSAGQDGHLHYWKDSQKSSFSHVSAAHGFDDSNNPRWISGLANIKMSNIVATGSNDGFVRIWTAHPDEKQIKQCLAVPVSGCVNAIGITQRLLVAGCGKEHKYGRWWNIKGNQNKLSIVRWKSSQ